MIANKSSRKFIEGDDENGMTLIDALRSREMIAVPLCSSVGMGGGEDGLLRVADKARAACADAVATMGGGAVQDAGNPRVQHPHDHDDVHPLLISAA